MRLLLLFHLLLICALKVEPIHSCESMFYAYHESRTLKVNANISSIHDIPAFGQSKRLCSVALVTSKENEVQVSVRGSSLPSPCFSHGVQVFEGPHLLTSWCENSTPSFRSLGSSLTIWYNASSVTNGSFTIDYHAVLRQTVDIQPCDFIPQVHNQTNHPPSSKDVWWLCRTVLYAKTFPRTLSATKNEFFTVYPHYERLTREWRIWSSWNRGVYVEIENNPNLSCSLGVIKVYDCEQRNNYRYLGSWCNGRNNTFRTASCLALRFNATNLPSGSNTIFSLTYRYPTRWSDGTTTRNPWIPASPTSSHSSQTGTIVGSVFGVVLLILAVGGALIGWKIYRIKNMSPYQNPQITHHSEAGYSVVSVTKSTFSSTVCGQVKSLGNDKEGPADSDSPHTSGRPVFQNECMSLCQPHDPMFPKGNVYVADRSATDDNHCNDGKDVSAPDNVSAIPHSYNEPEVKTYQGLPQYQLSNSSSVKGNVTDNQ